MRHRTTGSTLRGAVWCPALLSVSVITLAYADEPDQPSRDLDTGVFRLVETPGDPNALDDQPAGQPTHSATTDELPAWVQVALHVRQRAADQVRKSSRTENPYLRANAIEAALVDPDLAAALVPHALSDPEPVVRFAALVAVGKLNLEVHPELLEGLLNDPAPPVQAAAIYALHQGGHEVNATPLASMLAGQDPQVRGNAAMLLGMMGQPGTTQMLRDLARVPMPRAGAVQDAIVRLQIAEAVVRAGDDTGLTAIRAAAYSQFDEVRVMAVTMMGRFGDRRMEKAFAALMTEPPIELQVAAADALARLGRWEGQELVLKAAKMPAATVRSQAALTLGRFPNARSCHALIALMDDPAESVRLAAATGVIRLTADVATGAKK